MAPIVTTFDVAPLNCCVGGRTAIGSMPASTGLSVIIVSWNAREYLERCLESIHRNAPRCLLEVIVVDNASVDGSPEMVERIFPEVTLVRAGSNLGFSRANNLAMRQARGSMFALINSDALVHAGCLDTLWDYLQQHPEVCLAGPRVVGGDGTLQRTSRYLPRLGNTLCRAFALDRVFTKGGIFHGYDVSEDQHQTRHHAEALAGCFWLVRRAAIQQLGGFDERFFFYGEDIDWCKRAIDAGWTIAFIPEATATHFGGGSSARAPVRYSVEMLRATLEYSRKHYGMVGEILCLQLMVLHYGLRVLVRSLQQMGVLGSSDESRQKRHIDLACLRWLLLRSHPDAGSRRSPIFSRGITSRTSLQSTESSDESGGHVAGSASARILLVVENDHYPQDMRIYNECTALASRFDCYVIAPRAKGQKFAETAGSVRCYRYASIASQSISFIFLEYAIAWISIGLLVPLITIARRINVIHVANPPDFIVPTISWLKVLGVKIVFDMHDISAETLKGKLTNQYSWPSRLLTLLDKLEWLSIYSADLTIATNESILARIWMRDPEKPACVVRNGNRIAYRTTDDVRKPARTGPINIGYFGLLANDKAAGLENIVTVAETLASLGVPFRFSIVGSGPGESDLGRLIKRAGLESHFGFHGFVPIPQAYELIKDFDFGLVTWGDMPKNHLHTAMKVMDYMCCAVPVCSLLLKEQVRSTASIGIHAASFADIAKEIARLSSEPDEYEELRRRTLQHFNEELCWELQERKLLDAYRTLLDAEVGGDAPRCRSRTGP